MKTILTVLLVAIATVGFSTENEKTEKVKVTSNTYPLTYCVYTYAKGNEYMISTEVIEKQGLFYVNFPKGENITIIFYSENGKEQINVNGRNAKFPIYVKFNK